MPSLRRSGLRKTYLQPICGDREGVDGEEVSLELPDRFPGPGTTAIFYH